MTSTFDKLAKTIVEGLDGGLQQIEQKEEDIGDLKLRLDVMGMKDRDNNIIVSGPQKECRSKHEVTDVLLNDNLGTRIRAEDISQKFKLQKKREEDSAATRPRVLFKNIPRL